MEDIKCVSCGKKFKRKISQILLADKHYCSIKCQNLDRKKGKIIQCYICNKKVYKKNKDIVNSQSKKFFCSTRCSNVWLGSKNRSQNHPNWINGKSSYKNILNRTDAVKVCNLCGEKDRNVLVVHHIDQNRDNNALINLSWLCHNCHFLVHHYPDELVRFNNKIKSNANS